MIGVSRKYEIRNGHIKASVGVADIEDKRRGHWLWRQGGEEFVKASMGLQIL